MTIELDSTLAQAEVLFLSFSQLAADMDRRRAEQAAGVSNTDGLRRRGTNPDGETRMPMSIPVLSDDLRELLKAGR